MFTRYLQKLGSICTAAVLLCSCHNYYKATTVTPQQTGTTAAKVDSLRAANRYLILRNGDAAYAIKTLRVTDDQKAAVLLLDSVDNQHRHHLGGGQFKKKYKRANRTQNTVLTEAHIYVPYDAAAKTGEYTLALDRVQRIEVLQHDPKRSTNSHVLGGLGLVAGGLAIALVILVLSIPFD